MSNYWVQIQPNRGNFEFIGSEVKISGTNEISALWSARPDYWFFADHWPGNPVVPAAIQLEVLFQNTALILFSRDGNREKHILVTKIFKAKFNGQILPGDRITLRGKILELRRGLAKAQASLAKEEKEICSCSFEFFLPVEFNTNRPNG